MSSGESVCLCWLAGPSSLVVLAGSGTARQPEKALVSPTHLPGKFHGQVQCQGVQVITCFRKTKANNPRINVPKERSLGLTATMDVTNI